MDKEEIFLASLKDAKINAEFNNRITLFRFLDLHEQELVKKYIGDSLNVYFSSGFNDGEYKRCIIAPFPITPDFKITIFEVCYDKRFIRLGHKNILGALMSLGIKRDVIGDIVLADDKYYVAVVFEMKDYLINEVRNENIRFSLEERENINVSTSEEYDVKLYFLASMRLDLCISQVYHLSRAESFELISGGYVKLNHVLCQNSSKMLAAHDVVSIRTKGRMKVFSIMEKTKSGKIKAMLGRL